jgi:hypothetical protein
MESLETLETILSGVLDRLSEIASTLNDISGKLDNLNGIYGLDDVVAHLDDVVAHIDEGVDKILGPTGYNLADIHQELSNIDTTLMTKD